MAASPTAQITVHCVLYMHSMNQKPSTYPTTALHSTSDHLSQSSDRQLITIKLVIDMSQPPCTICSGISTFILFCIPSSPSRFLLSHIPVLILSVCISTYFRLLVCNTMPRPLRRGTAFIFTRTFLWLVHSRQRPSAQAGRRTRVRRVARWRKSPSGLDTVLLCHGALVVSARCLCVAFESEYRLRRLHIRTHTCMDMHIRCVPLPLFQYSTHHPSSFHPRAPPKYIHSNNR